MVDDRGEPRSRRQDGPPTRSVSSLHGLQADARRIWTDAEERARSIEAVVNGLDGEESTLRAAIQRLDRAVRVGLRALGFPRAPIRGVEVDHGLVLWAARKDADCTIYLSAQSLRAVLRQKKPDDIFRTWVHESLHARQPFSPNYRREYAPFPGFEEGLVEGLARSLLEQHAGFPAIAGSFDYYVAGYRALVAALEFEPDLIWQAMWRVRPGDVRGSLPVVLDALNRQQTGSRLEATRLSKLAGVADTIFSAQRSKQRPDEAQLSRLWKVALQ